MTRQRAWIVLLALVLAFGFLGTRGIWDPDEGRYTNVALNMLDTGDWLNPQRSHEVGHWTKPPLTYWTIAASVAAFGENTWAARLPTALAYLLCTFLAWRTARRIAPGAEDMAALAFATMLLPLGASQLVTTDFLLAACESLALWAFVEARFGDGRAPRRWIALMWAGFALAFLTKGPPGLLPLLVVVSYDLLVRDATPRHRIFDAAGLVVFVLLALPWFVAVILGNPGLFQYFIGDEVVNRVTSNEFGRHGEWYGWIEIYVPTLLLGTLPWTATLWRWAKRLPAAMRGWTTRAARRQDRGALLLALWIALPLLVFCLSQSRMPLYVLPLFVPLAIVVARQRLLERRGPPSWRAIAAWGVLLLALKVSAAHWPSHKDASAWADAIRARTQGPISEVLFVDDMARYGLHLHLNAEIEKLSLASMDSAARFNPEFDEDVLDELADDADPHALWVVREQDMAAVRRLLAGHGIDIVPQGTPYERRVLFRIVPLTAPAAAAPRSAAGG